MHEYQRITNTLKYFNFVFQTLRYAGESRKILDAFLRKLLDGNNANHPKPKSFKLTKSQLFPDKETVFDYLFDKRNNGSWISWMELEKEEPPPPNAKVPLSANSSPLLKIGLTPASSQKLVLCFHLRFFTSNINVFGFLF